MKSRDPAVLKSCSPDLSATALKHRLNFIAIRRKKMKAITRTKRNATKPNMAPIPDPAAMLLNMLLSTDPKTPAESATIPMTPYMTPQMALR